MKSLTISFLLITCCVSFTRAQSFRNFSSFLNPNCAELEKRNNELAYNGKPEGIFYCNPLVLDGMAFNYFGFTVDSKGELRLIKGEENGGNNVDIPFYLRLRRNGALVPVSCDDNTVFFKAEVSTILKFAHDGDELIVEPVNTHDWPAKRIIKIGDKC